MSLINTQRQDSQRWSKALSRSADPSVAGELRELRQSEALFREYGVLSRDALLVLLAARGVRAALDKRDHNDLVNLAVMTHRVVGDSLELDNVVRHWEKRLAGAAMMAPDLPTS